MSARAQILVRIIGRLRTAHYDLPAALHGVSQNRQRIGAGHQVGIDAEGRRTFRLQHPEERVTRTKGGIVSLHLESRRAQIRREVEQAERCIRLHDRQLFRIFVQKIPVS